MPVPVVTRLFGHNHHFRHHSRPRSPLLVLFGMIFLVALSLLLASPVSAFQMPLGDSVKDAPMTSYLEPHQKQPHAPPAPGSGTPQSPARETIGIVPQPGQPPNDIRQGQREQQHQEFLHEHSIDGDQKPLGMDQAPLQPLPIGFPPPSPADFPPLQITHLEPEHQLQSPSASGKNGKGKRLVFVGDVHGHLRPLKTLLQKIDFNPKNGDHLVFVGDIVAKGPDSAGVVQLAMDLGASAVRGNHEDKVLLAHKAIQKEKKKKLHNTASDGPEPELDEQSQKKKAHDEHAREVARSLSPKQIKWLSSLPFLLQIGPIPGATQRPCNAGEIVVVHAGLVPSLPLDQQTPWAMMNMRTLLYPALGKSSEDSQQQPTLTNDNPVSEDFTTTSDESIVAIPSDTRQGEPWSHAWNRFQNTAVPSDADRCIVIYGHDAKAGLQANMDVDIRPYPVSKKHHKKKKKHSKKGKKQHHRLSKRSDDDDDDGEDQPTIEININPEIEVESDGDTEVEVETEIEIEIENDGDSDNDSDSSTSKAKSKRNDDDVEADTKKKHKKKKSKMGLRYAFGLDSGCGHGRQLTALVLNAAGADGTVVHSVEQVDCDEEVE